MRNYRDLEIKLTPQRLALLEYLEGNKAHPSAEDIYLALVEKFPTLSLATVYNTLYTLKGKGMVAPLTVDPDRMRFDPNSAPHDHLMCLRCKKIVDIRVGWFIEEGEDAARGYEILADQVDLYGICPACRPAQGLREEATNKPRDEKQIN